MGGCSYEAKLQFGILAGNLRTWLCAHLNLHEKLVGTHSEKVGVAIKEVFFFVTERWKKCAFFGF